MIELGINSDTISYEIAIEKLGQMRQPLMHAISDEREKVNPSEPYIRYCQAKLRALDDLQDDLMPADHDTITRILESELTWIAPL